jgi:hypothetical protein
MNKVEQLRVITELNKECLLSDGEFNNLRSKIMDDDVGVTETDYIEQIFDFSKLIGEGIVTLEEYRVERLKLTSKIDSYEEEKKWSELPDLTSSKSDGDRSWIPGWTKTKGIDPLPPIVPQSTNDSDKVGDLITELTGRAAYDKRLERLLGRDLGL